MNMRAYATVVASMAGVNYLIAGYNIATGSPLLGLFCLGVGIWMTARYRWARRISSEQKVAQNAGG